MGTETASRRARPRRRPSRAIGRGIVEAILDASALLLERDGIDGLSTNVIARVAGVSVGSLYHYFPDKHAIVAELARRLQAVGRAFAFAHMGDLERLDLRGKAWRVVGLVSDPALGSVPLRRTLLREVPPGWIAEARTETQVLYEGAYAALLAHHAAELRPGPIEDLAFVAYHAVDSAMEGAILHQPTRLGGDALRRELFHLGYRYVVRDGADLRVPDDPLSAGAPAPAGQSDRAVSARLATEPSRRRDAHITADASAGSTTRQAILAAAARLLTRGGAPLVTARGIAREAGLAPGALYRHFPNTTSVLAQLALDHELAIRAAMIEGVDRVRGLRGRDAAEALVRVFASRERGEPALRRALRLGVPPLWAERASLETQAAARRELARMLGERGAEVREGDHELMAFVACRAVEGVLAAAVSRQRPIEPVIEEMTELVFRYLRAP